MCVDSDGEAILLDQELCRSRKASGNCRYLLESICRRFLRGGKAGKGVCAERVKSANGGYILRKFGGQKENQGKYGDGRAGLEPRDHSEHKHVFSGWGEKVVGVGKELVMQECRERIQSPSYYTGPEKGLTMRTLESP
jgi:hypothetical protein